MGIGIHIVSKENKNSGGGHPIIGSNVFIGAHAIILGNIKIGDHAIIGAGAVVINDVETGQTVVGVPAHPIVH